MSASRLDTFKSGEMGYLGYADSHGEVVFFRDTTRAHTHQTEFDVAGVKALPRVDIAMAYPGVDGTAVAALAKAGCTGIVAAGLGSGGVPRVFADALSEVAEQGVPVVITGQSGRGRVMGRRALLERGFIPAGMLMAPQGAHSAHGRAHQNTRSERDRADGATY